VTPLIGFILATLLGFGLAGLILKLIDWNWQRIMNGPAGDPARFKPEEWPKPKEGE
jgi:hypothetical protein